MTASGKSKRVVIAGGGGFIGRALANELLEREFEIVTLTRSPRERRDNVREIFWDGKSSGDWIRFLDDAEAVVNLAGKNVNCPHTPENLRELAASRVNSVLAIASGISQMSRPPRVWVQAGAVGFYGDTKEETCDENSPAGRDALAEICRQWEGAFNSSVAPNTRKVLLRIGFVLGRDGGALPVLGKLTKWFLGGAAGGGKQFISWIHMADLTRMFAEAVEQKNHFGIFNAVGPVPVTNKEFMRALRRTLRRPWSPPAPVWAVKFGARLLNSEPSLALSSSRVAPKRLLEAGFRFQFSELRAALKNLCE